MGTNRNLFRWLHITLSGAHGKYRVRYRKNILKVRRFAHAAQVPVTVGHQVRANKYTQRNCNTLKQTIASTWWTVFYGITMMWAVVMRIHFL